MKLEDHRHPECAETNDQICKNCPVFVKCQPFSLNVHASDVGSVPEKQLLFGSAPVVPMHVSWHYLKMHTQSVPKIQLWAQKYTFWTIIPIGTNCRTSLQLLTHFTHMHRCSQEHAWSWYDFAWAKERRNVNIRRPEGGGSPKYQSGSKIETIQISERKPWKPRGCYGIFSTGWTLPMYAPRSGIGLQPGLCKKCRKLTFCW